MDNGQTVSYKVAEKLKSLNSKANTNASDIRTNQDRISEILMRVANLEGGSSSGQIISDPQGGYRISNMYVMPAAVGGYALQLYTSNGKGGYVYLNAYD